MASSVRTVSLAWFGIVLIQQSNPKQSFFCLRDLSGSNPRIVGRPRPGAPKATVIPSFSTRFSMPLRPLIEIGSPYREVAILSPASLRFNADSISTVSTIIP